MQSRSLELLLDGKDLKWTDLLKGGNVIYSEAKKAFLLMLFKQTQTFEVG